MQKFVEYTRKQVLGLGTEYISISDSPNHIIKFIIQTVNFTNKHYNKEVTAQHFGYKEQKNNVYGIQFKFDTKIINHTGT